MDVTDSPNLSRRTSLRDRPQNAPMGPRTRQPQRTAHLSFGSSAGPQSPRESALYSPAASPRYSAPYSPAGEQSDTKALSAIAERTYSPRPPSDGPPSPLSVSSTPPEQPSVKAVPKATTLIPPPKIKFDSVPVKWKGLPLEAALWTFNSKELQELVSRAIRSSSRESFIRLLSVETLDHSLPDELDRLNALKAMTQSKYRFTVHRRTMLLQALNSFSGTYTDGGKDGGVELVTKLTGQLSQTMAECDQLLEDLLQIADQIAQIMRLLDTHWASALATALRKLNSSYGRRTTELLAARERIGSLEAELNDAWQQAETLAREMDGLDADDDEGDAVIEVAEVVSLHHRSPSAASQLSLHPMASLDAIARLSLTPPLRPNLLLSSSSEEVTPAASVLEMAMEGTASSTSVLESGTEGTASSTSVLEMAGTASSTSVLESGTAGTTSPWSVVESETAIEREAVFEPEPETPTDSETPTSALDSEPPISAVDTATDTASIRSARSLKSVRSAKSGRTTRSQRTADASRLSTVSAARRRSLRTSMGSLRLPSLKSAVRRGATAHPPVPTLPPPADTASFLDFGSRDDSDAEEADEPRPRLTSIDDIEVVARAPVVAIQTRDDIHVMPRRSVTENELVGRRGQFSLDHQHPFAIEEPVTQAIPSIWLLQETPKTPAERVESMLQERSTKIGSFQRFKSLTKRYSLPFPAAGRSKRGGGSGGS
ncbi:hypothetical protein B0H10DRAFT_2130634 [Mycena sp. CBHHK59/15]|nr:hypothetical protein B0H10DRAFT_2130634 [Mycena sp. CBHHK59/15]